MFSGKPNLGDTDSWHIGGEGEGEGEGSPGHSLVKFDGKYGLLAYLFNL